MLRFPNAKINIGLQITEKRSDGYHNLNTVFVPIPYQDALEILPANELQFTSKGLTINGDPSENLILKAYHLMQSKYPQIGPLHIVLQKVIPMGAGLGGGSADGTFMLQLLNDYYKLGLDIEQIASLALELGSDCPFFAYNQPCFATGRGEEIRPMNLPQLSQYSFVLVLPNLHISTAAAFKGIVPTAASFDLQTLPTLAVEDWKEHVHNDFEATVFPQYPILAEIKAQLYAQGAIYAAMSGTGAAMYAIMPKGKSVQLHDLDGKMIFLQDLTIK